MSHNNETNDGQSSMNITDEQILSLLQSYHKVTFDPRARGWVGPLKETHSKWAKARGAVMVSVFNVT